MASAMPLLAAVLLVMCVSHGTAVEDVRLGFLLPFPDGDSAVPARLADEWISAARIAVDVLGRQYRHLVRVKPFIANSNCNQQAAADAAEKLVEDLVVGVVGPACSEAVKGASQVLRSRYVPLVSFAATADTFSGDLYSTFFRTVYSDRFQAKAIQDVIGQYGWTNIYLFYSDETYGNNLRDDIQNYAQRRELGSTTIRVPYPPPAASSTYEWKQFFYVNGRLITSNDSTIVIFAALPNVVEGLWRAAYDLGLLGYPWWYLVSDGGTTFDLVGIDAASVPLGSALQGELGISPYRGKADTDAASPFEEFRAYWQQQQHSEYPGLLTLPVTPRFEQPRAYVLHLIDAIWAFFKAFENILVVQRQSGITPRLVLEVFKNRTGNGIHFKGVTGPVSFNPDTGDRNQDLKRATFALNNLVGVGWKDVAKWQHTGGDSFLKPELVLRPGPLPQGVTLPEGQQIAAPYSVPEELQSAVPSPSGSSSNESLAQWVASEAGSSSNAGWIIGGLIVILVALLIFGWALWRAGPNATGGGGGGSGGAGYTSGFYGGGEGPLSVLLAARRSELVAAAALGRSLGLGERAFKVASGGKIVAADDVIRGALAALSVGHGGLGAASPATAKPIQPVHLAMLTLAAASASAALARPGQDCGPSALRSVACEAAGSGAVHASVDARKASTTDYHVVRIPGDGRCLFHAVAHGHHARASLPQPTALSERCELADALRNQVADEFVKRREETEWFLEGNFDDYVANIRKPYVWGGEPELLMLSHVLKSPITVFIADPRSPRSGAIMPIAEYGREYAGKQEGNEGRVEGEGISSSKDAICVLYNGSSHYDALIIPRSAAVQGTQQHQQARL
ncbi:unnamed protein product [Closterium sp. Yama58-4]|nr:unnamed protein product [Closterium sp. Yama58-4]